MMVVMFLKVIACIVAFIIGRIIRAKVGANRRQNALRASR